MSSAAVVISTLRVNPMNGVGDMTKSVNHEILVICNVRLNHYPYDGQLQNSAQDIIQDH